MHSYYTDDDLNVVRWAWSSATVAGNLTAHESGYVNNAWENAIFGEGVTTAEKLTRYGTVVTSGFYIDGKSAPLTSGSSYWLDQGALSITYLGVEVFRQAGTFARESAYRWFFNPDVDNSHNPRIAPWTGSSYLLGTANPPDAHPGNHWSYAEQIRCAWSVTFVNESGSESHSSALVIPAQDCSAVYIGEKQTRSGSRNVSGLASASGSVAEVREWLCVLKFENGNFIGVEVVGQWTPPVKRQYCVAYQSNWGGGGTSTGSSTTSINNVTPVINRHAAATLPVGGVDSEIFYPGALRTKLLQQVASITSALYHDARYNTETLSGGETAATSGYPTDISLFVGAA